MKKQKTRLGLASETIRALANTKLENAAGGFSGLRCDTGISVCNHCNSYGWICVRSQQQSDC